MKIHLATDHAGFLHKEVLKKYLIEEGIEVIDHGASVLDTRDDYPDYIIPCAKAVALDPESIGIIFGFTGQGEAMAANRTPGIRAAVYYGGPADILTLSREHNNANILSIGAHFVSADDVLQMVPMWLGSAFTAEERHARRIAKF